MWPVTADPSPCSNKTIPTTTASFKTSLSSRKYTAWRSIWRRIACMRPKKEPTENPHHAWWCTNLCRESEAAADRTLSCKFLHNPCPQPDGSFAPCLTHNEISDLQTFQISFGYRIALQWGTPETGIHNGSVVGSEAVDRNAGEAAAGRGIVPATSGGCLRHSAAQRICARGRNSSFPDHHAGRDCRNSKSHSKSSAGSAGRHEPGRDARPETHTRQRRCHRCG